jgi:hypothetical protein
MNVILVFCFTAQQSTFYRWKKTVDEIPMMQKAQYHNEDASNDFHKSSS